MGALSTYPAGVKHLQGGGLAFDVHVKTASYTLTREDSGRVFIANAGDLVFTLPATEAGLHYRFLVGPSGVAGSVGLQISPAAVDAIHGNGLTSVDDKDLILAVAADREGDAVELVGDGVDGWYIQSVTGTWSKQA